MRNPQVGGSNPPPAILKDLERRDILEDSPELYKNHNQGDITMPPDGGVFIKESAFVLKQGKPMKLD